MLQEKEGVSWESRQATVQANGAKRCRGQGVQNKAENKRKKKKNGNKRKRRNWKKRNHPDQRNKRDKVRALVGGGRTRVEEKEAVCGTAAVETLLETQADWGRRPSRIGRKWQGNPGVFCWFNWVQVVPA